MAMRKAFESNVRFMLMNSFSTSEDTLDFLKKYPELVNDPNLELMQVCLFVVPRVLCCFFNAGWVNWCEPKIRTACNFVACWFVF